MNIQRLSPGQSTVWRDAVSSLVPPAERDHELISTREAERSLEDDRCYLLVAQEEDSPMGLLSAFRFPDVDCGGSLVYLYNIDVAPARRNQGIGRSLISELLRLCYADDVDVIWAGTESNNRAARAIFEATGARLDSESYTEYEWFLD